MFLVSAECESGPVVGGLCKTASRAGGFALPAEAIEDLRKDVSEMCATAYRAALMKYVAESDTD